jgi:hypothetical protein
MINPILPKTYQFGGVELVEVKHLETMFAISHRVAMKYLKVLHIRPMYFGDDVFFCLSTFNRIMHVLNRPGSKGFLFPASRAKNNAVLRKSGDFLIEVTDEILTEAASPRVLAEMAAVSGRSPDMVKKLIAQSNAESRKK